VVTGGCVAARSITGEVTTGAYIFSDKPVRGNKWVSLAWTVPIMAAIRRFTRLLISRGSGGRS